MVIPTNIKPVQFPLVEHVWLLRKLREVKTKLQEDMIALEERMKSAHNGDLARDHRTLDGEKAICDMVIRRLWQAADMPAPPAPPVAPP